MKRIFLIITLASLLFVSQNVVAQSYLDIRINEVQITNNKGYINENGERCGWLELFNSAYGTIDVGGFYVSDTEQTDIVNNPKGKVFVLPKGNPNTIIPLRGYLILFADGNTKNGALHMNYTLDGVKNLFIYEPGGQIIDRVELPEIPEDESYGRIVDGEGAHEPLSVTQRSIRKASIDSKIGADKGWRIMEYPTPAVTNTTSKVQTKSEKQKETDPYGLILFITCFSVVFIALILLFFCFNTVGKRAMKKNPKLHGVDSNTKLDEALEAGASVSAERYAAVALACYLFQEENDVHDYESDIITINKEYNHNSPWSMRR